MSKFYSSCQGSCNQEATRRGHTWVRASAQSWEGSICVSLTANGEEPIIVHITAGPGTSKYHVGYTLYRGPLADLLAADGRAAIVRTFAAQELEREYAKGA